MKSAKSRLVRCSVTFRYRLRGPRFTGHKQITGALPLVLIVVAFRLPWLHRQRDSGLTHQLLAGFVQADLGLSRVVGTGVDRQHLLHLAGKLGIALGRDTPLLVAPRLEFVVLSHLPDGFPRDALHDVYLHQLVGQQLQSCPCSGWLHGKRDQIGLLLSIQFAQMGRARPMPRQGCGQSLFHKALPHASNRRDADFQRLAIAWSVQPGPPWLLSAFTKMRAWVSFRADTRPWPISLDRSTRSSSANFTIYFFMGLLLLSSRVSFLAL
jgi:hypothetical protein